MDFLKYGNPVNQVTVGDSAAYPFSTYSTIQEAINGAQPGDHISIYPGTYAENVVIGATKRDLVIIGAGSEGRIAIAPASGVALELNGARGITLVNLDIAAVSGAASALYVHEDVRGLRAYNCKIEGSDTVQIQIGHTAADSDAPADCVFTDCEVAWGAGSGILFGTSSDEFPTEIYFRNLTLHDITGASWVGLSAGGSFHGVFFSRCDFLLGEGAAPTKGIDISTADGALVGGSIQLASNAAGLGTHTNMKFRNVAFTDSTTTV